jgi:hypothetical protein
MVTNGPNGFNQGFLLGCFCASPLVICGIWMGCFQPHPLLLCHGLDYICFLCMPPLSMDPLICGLDALFLIGLPLFISGGFYFARFSFVSCTFSFNLVATLLLEKCEMTFTLLKWGLGSPPGLPKLQSSITGVKTPCIEKFFIPLENH